MKRLWRSLEKTRRKDHHHRFRPPSFSSRTWNFGVLYFLTTYTLSSRSHHHHVLWCCSIKKVFFKLVRVKRRNPLFLLSSTASSTSTLPCHFWMATFLHASCCRSPFHIHFPCKIFRLAQPDKKGNECGNYEKKIWILRRKICKTVRWVVVVEVKQEMNKFIFFHCQPKGALHLCQPMPPIRFLYIHKRKTPGLNWKKRLYDYWFTSVYTL